VPSIAQAAQELIAKRDHWLNRVPPGRGLHLDRLSELVEPQKRTLTNPYNQRPTGLDQAHGSTELAALDTSVFASCYLVNFLIFSPVDSPFPATYNAATTPQVDRCPDCVYISNFRTQEESDVQLDPYTPEIEPP
jgi:hypothetical protein